MTKKKRRRRRRRRRTRAPLLHDAPSAAGTREGEGEIIKE
jgi:hypothetical protein